MTKILTILIGIVFAITILNAQDAPPQAFSFKATIQGANGQTVVNKKIRLRISILQDDMNGQTAYSEYFTPTTNHYSQVDVEIGHGNVLSGSFSSIDWSAHTYFLKVEVDAKGGTNYQLLSVTQLLSVPYALYAGAAGSGFSGNYSDLIGAPDLAVVATTGDYYDLINEPTLFSGDYNDLTNKPTTLAGDKTGDMQYWDGSEWVIVAAGNEGQVLTFTSGVPTWTSTGGGGGWGDVYNPTTGKTWMDRNLGASQVATSSTDGASYGDLYQWGRGTDGHEKRTSGTTTTLSTDDTPGHGTFIVAPDSPNDWRSPQNDNLWQGVSGINNPCPTGYRLPTEAELETERLSWGSNNTAGAIASPLKLPVAGYRSGRSGFLTNMYSGFYLSSTVAGANSRILLFHSSDAYMTSDYRANGRSVRCLKD